MSEFDITKLYDVDTNVKSIKVLDNYEGNEINGITVSKILTKGKCGETCQLIYDSEEKILYIYGNGEISQFDDISDTIKQQIKEIHIQNGIKSIKSNILNQFTSLEIIEYNGIESIHCSEQSVSNSFVGIKVNEEYKEKAHEPKIKEITYYSDGENCFVLKS